LPKKKATKRKSKSLPALKFDSSGSAEAIFIGLPVEIGIHWAECDLKQHQLICPERINLDGKKCMFCEQNVEDVDDYLEDIVEPSAPIVTKGMALCWDTVREKWSFLLTYHDFFRRLIRDVNDGGYYEDFQSGDGPRFILQRVGKRMEVATSDLWGELKNFSAPPAPSMNDVLTHLERKSIWVKHGKVAEVEEQYPRSGEGPPGIDSLRMMGTDPHFSFKGYQGPPPIGPSTVAKDIHDDDDEIAYEDLRGQRDRRWEGLE
jgi:hypothetical protein